MFTSSPACHSLMKLLDALKSSRGVGLQIKIGFTIIGLTTLTLGGFGLYQYQNQQRRAQEKLTSLANTIAGQMALSVAIPVWNYNMEDLAAQVEAAMQEKELLAVVVSDSKTAVLISKRRDTEWNVVDMTGELTEEFPPIVRDLVYEGKSIGTVQVAMTTRFMQAELRQTIIETSIAIIALDMILFSGLLISLRVLMIAPLSRLLRVAPAMADGNFQQEIDTSRRDEIGLLSSAFGEMQVKIAEVVRDVKNSTAEVALRSREMSMVAEQMSQGASQQAAATEEVSASMEEMAANIRQTVDNAKITEEMAVKSADDARLGNHAVIEIIHAMEVIAERISIVQEIASQTNLLSLNAAIEAAKAQEYGKGFSVVAASVRELAHQSRSAADEIRRLVHSCVTLSAQAGEVLQRLAPNSEKTAELVQDINAANQEQFRGIEQVNRAIQQLDTVTQQNAATAEEVASSAESLTMQADTLQQTMAFFTVADIQTSVQAQEHDILELLHGLKKDRLVALLQSAISETPMSDASPKTLKPSASSALERRLEKRSDAPNVQDDDLDREFEHF